jgi:hypothetical protein
MKFIQYSKLIKIKSLICVAILVISNVFFNFFIINHVAHAADSWWYSIADFFRPRFFHSDLGFYYAVFFGNIAIPFFIFKYYVPSKTFLDRKISIKLTNLIHRHVRLCNFLLRIIIYLIKLLLKGIVLLAVAYYLSRFAPNFYKNHICRSLTIIITNSDYNILVYFERVFVALDEVGSSLSMLWYFWSTVISWFLN